MKSMHALQAEDELSAPKVEVGLPQCVILLGHTRELDNRSRRRSFDAYRSELRNVRIVTFDELVTKLHGLIALLTT